MRRTKMKAKKRVVIFLMIGVILFCFGITALAENPSAGFSSSEAASNISPTNDLPTGEEPSEGLISVFPKTRMAGDVYYYYATSENNLGQYVKATASGSNLTLDVKYDSSRVPINETGILIDNANGITVYSSSYLKGNTLYKELDLSSYEDGVYTVFVSAYQTQVNRGHVNTNSFLIYIQNHKIYFEKTVINSYNEEVIKILENNTTLNSFKTLKEEYSAEESVLKEIQNTTSSITQNCSNDYEKAVAINTWITDNIYYDNQGLKENNRDIYSGTKTFSKKRGVCDGYAKLAVLMFGYADIPCEYVLGIASTSSDLTGNKGYHAWNAVKIDGNWSFLDTTWNTNAQINSDGKVAFDNWAFRRHDYFLVTSEHISKDHRATSIGYVPRYAYELKVDAEEGGTVKVPKSPYSNGYAGDEIVVVTAIPDEGYKFSGWFENGKQIENAQAEYTFLIGYQNRNLIAKFEKLSSAPQLQSYSTSFTGSGTTAKGLYDISFSGMFTTDLLEGTNVLDADQLAGIQLKGTAVSSEGEVGTWNQNKLTNGVVTVSNGEITSIKLYGKTKTTNAKADTFVIETAPQGLNGQTFSMTGTSSAGQYQVQLAGNLPSTLNEGVNTLLPEDVTSLKLYGLYTQIEKNESKFFTQTTLSTMKVTVKNGQVTAITISGFAKTANGTRESFNFTVNY